MTDSLPASSTMPSLGDPINMSVTAAPMRTTLFPENFIVATPKPDAIELIFLRHELVVLSQDGVVSRASDGSVDLSVTSTAMTGQVQDVGHVRLGADKAVELAIGILRHAAEYHARDMHEILASLAQAEETAT